MSPSVQDPAPGLLHGPGPRTPMRTFDREIVSVFLCDEPCLVQIADHMGPDQDDELGLSETIIPKACGVSDERDVSNDGNLGAAHRAAILDQTAEDQGITVVQDDTGLDLALSDGRRIDVR